MWLSKNHPRLTTTLTTTQNNAVNRTTVSHSFRVGWGAANIPERMEKATATMKKTSENVRFRGQSHLDFRINTATLALGSVAVVPKMILALSIRRPRRRQLLNHRDLMFI